MEKVWKDNCRVTITEWGVKEINADGDAIDTDWCPTLAEGRAAWARARANGFDAPVVALVFEKAIHKVPSHYFAEPDKYKVLDCCGNDRALDEGGWLTAKAAVERATRLAKETGKAHIVWRCADHFTARLEIEPIGDWCSHLSEPIRPVVIVDADGREHS